jgi:hypothetical protein
LEPSWWESMLEREGEQKLLFGVGEEEDNRWEVRRCT